jgi:leucine dehydrogenase
MDLRLQDEGFGHERLHVFRDPATGVTGAIAIHSTALGPAMGGLRLFAYPGLDEAIGDVLDLARAMSFKNAAAGLELGGGKAVIVDDGRWGDEDLRTERMRVVGETIESLGGRYVTAEDVGTTPADMDAISAVTRHVAGGTAATGGSGDPSPFTARTVLAAIEAGVRVRLRRDSLAGCRVGVQGVGHVGAALVELLCAAGAEVFITDADPRRCLEIAELHGATPLPSEDFLFGDFEVLAPCAMGGAIGLMEADRLGASVVAGAANNPLRDRDVAVRLASRGVLFVPDFIANAGGIIHVGAEVLDLSPERVDELLTEAGARAGEILRIAAETRRLPLVVAEQFALERLTAPRAVSPPPKASV